MSSSLNTESLSVCLILLSVTVVASAVQNTTISKLNGTPYKTEDTRLTYMNIAALTNQHKPPVRPVNRYVAAAPGIPTPKTEEVYEPVLCPTTACKCSKDIDQTPPYSQINCRYENLDRIPRFSNTSITYDELTFSMENNITIIPTGAFRNLKVKKIDLENNDVHTVEDGAFFGLDPVLKTLYLQGNGAIRIPYDKISNLVSLTNLKMVNFQEDRIHANNKFGSFEKLEILEMREIKGLTAVDPQAFKGKLPLLTELVFDTVGFKDIPVAALQQLKNIRKLGIHNSQISIIHANSFDHQNFQSLTQLELRRNKITFIQSHAFEKVCESLEILDLTNNYINKTSLSAFETKTWEKLHTLNLSYNNRIGSITSSVFRNMPNLLYLNLMSINLQMLSADVFIGLNNLHALELSYNRILGITNSAFSGMPVLKDLRLGHQSYDDPFQANELDLYPAMFDGITTSLTDLSLEGTPVRVDHFWRTIQVLTSLETLRAGQTGLTIIPDNAFVHNTRLQVIELGRNGISHLSNSAFQGLENSLIKIMLQSNNLTSISKCVFKDFTMLDNVMLVGNNLHCDCKLTWLHEFIIKKSKEDKNFQKYNYECSSPEKFQYKFLFTIDIADLPCSGSAGETCHYITEASTTAGTTSKPVTDSSDIPLSTEDPATINLYTGGATETALMLYWNVHGNKEPITGFKLEYYSVIDNVKHTIPLHAKKTGYEITRLKPGVFYKICVTVEYLTNKEKTPADCKTRQTLSQKPKYEGYKDENPNNTVVIVLVTTVIVVVLIIAGLYMLVKYKIQKLKELRLTMASPGLGHFDPSMDYCGQEESSTTVPNEYTEIQAAKLAQMKKIYNTKQLQKQLAVDNTYHNRANSTYHKIKDKKHKKTTEELEQVTKVDTDYTEVNEQLKADVVQRHSAPCRLDAGDLIKAGKTAQARPLPATPTDHSKAEKTDLKDQQEKANHVFMTQASVYEHKVIETMETVEEDKHEKIYHEISGNDTLPKT